VQWHLEDIIRDPAIDPVEALRLYHSAVERGDSIGQYLLGEAYDMGLAGLPADDTEAAGLYMQAAAPGLAAAQARLALLGLQGKLPVRDDASSARWYHLAAEQEWPEGMVGWGYMLDNAIGTERNRTEAVEWYRRAAAYGQADAMLNLGAHYLHGDTVTRDLSEAYYWTLLAERSYQERSFSANDGAQRTQLAAMKRDLESALSADARTEAVGRIRRFIPRPMPSFAGAKPRTQESNTP